MSPSNRLALKTGRPVLVWRLFLWLCLGLSPAFVLTLAAVSISAAEPLVVTRNQQAAVLLAQARTHSGEAEERQRSAADDGVRQPGYARDNWMEEAERLLYKLQLLEQEIARLDDIIAQQALYLEELKAEQTKRYLDLDRRLEETGKVPGLSFSGESPPAAQQAGAEEVIYKSAFQMVRDKAFDQAVGAFQRLLEQYPEGRFAGNALFWLGEVYLILAKPDIENSRQSFMQLVERHPQHKKVPDALFRLGQLHDRLGQKEKSNNFLNQVIKQHPNSPAAKLALSYSGGSR